MNLFDADGLPGEDRAEIDFFVSETDAATASDHDRFVVKRRFVPALTRWVAPALIRD